MPYIKSIIHRLLIVIALAGLSISISSAETDAEYEVIEPVGLSLPEKIEWYSQTPQGHPRLHFYFFWSKYCPHCQASRPLIEKLPDTYPWLILHSYEVAEHEENIELFMWMSALMDEDANAVPAFMFCDNIIKGFDADHTTGKTIRAQLETCHAERLAVIKQGRPITAPYVEDAEIDEDEIRLPLLGKLDRKDFSLPMYTVIIAGLDAFNPCAFFVLLFLLSLLVHARNRARMLFIGGVFVFFSGFIYFLFMSAWLNVFLFMGELRIITAIAALLAIFAALVNIKDFFWFHRGLSLSIPDSAKPKLFERMRGLLNADNMLALTVGTVTLAIAANTYELLCTSGFPMIYTRLLTLAKLSTGSYYSYLVLYNIIYVIPLLVIVLVFTYTLGARKLQEQEGRLLKLMSGLMMLGLGLVLLVAPHYLSNLLVAGGIVGTAILITALFYCRDAMKCKL